jgi:GNAT superfamily N-acetyltransferase
MPELIRRAGPADAEALAEIGRATFTETFGHLYPPQDLAYFLAQSHGPERTERDLADPDCAAFLAEVDGRVAGYGLAGPCALPHPDVTPGCGELKRLYLLAAYQGAGLGGRLFEEAIGWLIREGPRQLWIGVWAENHGARRFYARHGFETVGRYEFPVGRARDQELILRRAAHEISMNGAS